MIILSMSSPENTDLPACYISFLDFFNRPDQLSENISSLENCNKSQNIIFMSEVKDECTYVKHHKKKIVFLISAMRHFKKRLFK